MTEISLQSTQKVEVTIEYSKEKADIENGVFEGGVKEPECLNELSVWVDDLTEFDFDSDQFVAIGNQINISGSDRALYELGKYLIAISMFETKDPRFHAHIDSIETVQGEKKCELLIRKSEQDTH